MAQNLRDRHLLMIDPGLFLLSCDTIPPKWHEPLYVPILVTIVAAIIYGLGVLAEGRELKKKPWKWASLAFLGLGMFAGGKIAWCVTDTFYRSLVNEYGKKMMLGHVASFVIPLVGLLIIGIHYWITSRDPYRE